MDTVIIKEEQDNLSYDVNSCVFQNYNYYNESKEQLISNAHIYNLNSANQYFANRQNVQWKNYMSHSIGNNQVNFLDWPFQSKKENTEVAMNSIEPIPTDNKIISSENNCSTDQSNDSIQDPILPESISKIPKNLKDSMKKISITQGENVQNTPYKNQSNRQFKCTECDKSFKLLQHLKVHNLLHTGERPFQCDVCEKTFTTAGNMKTHKLIHSGDRPFKCDLCTKGFTTAGNLSIHKLTHTGIKPFICDICQKGFTTAGNLKIHKFVHSGEKPFLCFLCSKGFTTAGNLRIHSVKHTGERAFVCDICNKGFTTSGNLKIHKQNHVNEQPLIVCQICNQKFPTNDEYEQHKLTHLNSDSVSD